MAKAAASKAGPRLAEVAGKARCSAAGRWVSFLFFFLDILVLALDIGVGWCGSFCLLQSPDDGIQVGIEDDGRVTERIQRGIFLLVRGAVKKLATMEFHGEIGILQQVSSEDQDYCFIRL